MTKSGGIIPPLQILGGTCPRLPLDLRPRVIVVMGFAVEINALMTTNTPNNDTKNCEQGTAIARPQDLRFKVSCISKQNIGY